MTGPDWRSDVLDFWFALPEERWWGGTPELDSEIRDRFIQLWKEKRQLPSQSFLKDPRSAIAGVILFDQFPRNMFRGDAEQFATDSLAMAIAIAAVDRKLDQQLSEAERTFLYMPFQHSEKLENQDRAVLLFAALGDGNQLNYAQKHRDIIARFGRFPHRNAMLGRAPRADEIAAGDVFPW